MSICLIRTTRVWSKAEIREYVENFIASIQTHGDEPLLTRTNDAEQLGLLPADYDTSGADTYRNTIYLPRALAGGQMAKQLTATNTELALLIQLQTAVAQHPVLAGRISGDDSIPEQIEVAPGEMIDNPAYADAVSEHADAMAVVSAATATRWRWLAQRLQGAEIEDTDELHRAVIWILPTAETLEAYVEGEGLGSVDGRHSLSTARAAILSELAPNSGVNHAV